MQIELFAKSPTMCMPGASEPPENKRGQIVETAPIASKACSLPLALASPMLRLSA
jgi:hypothetical protein